MPVYGGLFGNPKCPCKVSTRPCVGAFRQWKVFKCPYILKLRPTQEPPPQRAVCIPKMHWCLPKNAPLFAEKTHFVPPKSPAATKKSPKMYQPQCTQKPPYRRWRNGPPQIQYAPTKTHFLPPKKIWLPHVSYTCGPLCTKKPTWLPPFILKNPRMGCLGVSSFPALSITEAPLLHPSKTPRGHSHLVP